MKKIILNFLKRLGYRITKYDPNCQQAQWYTIYRYVKKDGSFDYEAYRRIQSEGNKNKIDNVWAIEENIIFLSSYIERVVEAPSFGICHGTRRGNEQMWFRRYLKCDVIGTEISDTADQFPDTIQWDYHKTKKEWINATDFIYSNSFDHSYDPEKCLNAWMSCLKKGGICILEHSTFDYPESVSKLDPFGADIVQMPYLILTWGKGNYGIREIIEAPSKQHFLKGLYFIIIMKL